MFDYLKNRVTSAVNELGDALSASDEQKAEKLRARIRKLDLELDRKRARFEARLQQKLDLLRPAETVPGYSRDHYAGLDPINFARPGEESWLAGVATGIINKFPGADALLSQLDQTLLAYSEANHIRVMPDGPYDELLEVRDRILRVYDITAEVPIFLSWAKGSDVLGCTAPFVVLDKFTLDGMTPEEREALLATKLAHLFFGNLRIFAFHRLMGLLDKMPSVAGLVQKGLGMIPTIGNTISRSIEIARSVNDNLIRKTNLIIGLQNHMRCDRLALLALNDERALQRVLVRRCYGRLPTDEIDEAAFIDQLVDQGERVETIFREGRADMHMLAVIGPDAEFAPYRLYKIEEWRRLEECARIRDGYYVTSSEVERFQHTHRQLERDIATEESRVFELEEELARLRARLERLVLVGEDQGPVGGEGEAEEPRDSEGPDDAS